MNEIIHKLNEIEPGALAAWLGEADAPRLIDVREADELRDGMIGGAVHVPRGELATHMWAGDGDGARREAAVVLYCAGGRRSLMAAAELVGLGFQRVLSLAGGFDAWVRAGLAVSGRATGLSPEACARYQRQMRLPAVGVEGQVRLGRARVLVVGAGGLGSPVAFYLAAAGVGTLGLVDDDVVDRSNLQRQILHTDASVGVAKVVSAAERLRALNPGVIIETFGVRLGPDNVDAVMDGWDVVVDGSDNFATRHLVNEACVARKIPNVHGSVHRFDGQVAVFGWGDGPCYRCLHPEPLPPELAPACADAGVLGAVCGVIGSLQAAETLKILLGVGDVLSGRVLAIDVLTMQLRSLRVQRNPTCPSCGDASFRRPVSVGDVTCNSTR